MSEKQLEIDFPRYRRLRWLERLIIPRFERQTAGERRLARTPTAKSLLKVIECHARDGKECFLKRSTIAQEMNVSERTASRAIADCERLGLLRVKKRSFSRNDFSVYEIDWCEVKQMLLDNPKTAGVVDPNSGESRPSATRDNLAATRDNLSATRDNLSPPQTGRTSYSRGRALKHYETTNKPTCSDVGLDGDQEEAQKDEDREENSGNGGWPFYILPRHMTTMTVVQQLFEHARDRGWLRDDDRLRFFTLCKHVSGGVAAGSIFNPGGRLTAYLKESASSSKWPGNNAEEDAARNAIRKLDMGEVRV